MDCVSSRDWPSPPPFAFAQAGGGTGTSGWTGGETAPPLAGSRLGSRGPPTFAMPFGAHAADIYAERGRSSDDWEDRLPPYRRPPAQFAHCLGRRHGENGKSGHAPHPDLFRRNWRGVSAHEVTAPSGKSAEPVVLVHVAAVVAGQLAQPWQILDLDTTLAEGQQPALA